MGQANDRKAIVGVHGVIFEQPFERYFSKKRTLFHFREKLASDTRDNLIGTGTMAFHSSRIAFDYRSLPRGMADIGVAIAAKTAGVEMIAIARPAKWLKPIVIEGRDDRTLFDEFQDNDKEHTELLKRHGDWKL